MIKLEAQCTTFGGIFYFHDMEDCDDFMYVFKDHWCNVPWKQPVEIPDDTCIDDYDINDMNKPAKERAEDNLSWGFNLVKHLEIGDSKDQLEFARSMANKL